MNRAFLDLDALPLRFNPPDGWRTPDAQWISLYQGFSPPADWRPYPEAPPIPPSWPWWEENGTAWYTFFRSLAPLPARALGNWFSLSALGLFTIVVSPFALTGWVIGVGGILGVLLMIIGIRGVVRTLRKQSTMPQDPVDAIREWAAERRDTYFAQAYKEARSLDPDEVTLDEFVQGQVAIWWDETSEAAKN